MAVRRGLTTESFSETGARAQRFSRSFPPKVSFWDPSYMREKGTNGAGFAPAFFLFHRARRIFFLMFQKENGGRIPAGTPQSPTASGRPARPGKDYRNPPEQLKWIAQALALHAHMSDRRAN